MRGNGERHDTSPRRNPSSDSSVNVSPKKHIHDHVAQATKVGALHAVGGATHDRGEWHVAAGVCPHKL